MWEVFGLIKTDTGETLDKMVACRTCLNAYKYNYKSTSNLVKHKCYYVAKNNRGTAAVDVDVQTKAKMSKIVTQWTVENCRPFEIVNDTGLHDLIEHCIQLGTRFSEKINIKSLLPQPETILNNIELLYQTYHQKLRNDVKSIKTTGFGLTADQWTDKYLRKTYVPVTIHFVKRGQLERKLLGLISMEEEKCTRKLLLF